MRVILKNFKSWYSKELEIKDDGIILLSGKSGKGKSSILDAMFYCLFGEGKKVVSHGKSSCEVIMHIDNFTISRTNKPSRLHLISDQGEFEDDVAQSIINDHFGELFDVVSYVKQNGYNTFLKMSPTEKLEFIERALFQHTNIGDLKRRAKEYYSECNDNLVKCISRISTLKEMLESLSIPEKVDFPVKVKKEDYEKVERSENVKKKNSETTLKKLKSELMEFQNLVNALSIFLESQKNNNKNIQKIEKDIDRSLEELYNYKKDYIGMEKMNELKDKKEYLISRKKIKELFDKISIEKYDFQLLKKQELEENKKLFQSIENRLWKDGNNEEIQEKINIDKLYIEDLKRLKILKDNFKVITEDDLNKYKYELSQSKDNLQEIIKSIETLEKSKDILICPHCENSVVITDEGLEKSEYLHTPDVDQKIKVLENEKDTVNNNIKILEKKYSSLLREYEKNKNIGEQINEIYEQYEGLSDCDVNDFENMIEETCLEIINYEKYIRLNQSDEEKLKSLKKIMDENSLSKSLQIMEKRINDYEDEYKKINSKNENNEYINLNLEEIEEELQQQTVIENKINNTEIQLKNLQNISKNLSEEIAKSQFMFLERYNLSEIPIEFNLLTKIEEIKIEIINAQEKYDKSVYNLQQIEKYKNYIVAKENYDNIYLKIKNDEIEEKEYRNLLSGSSMLKDKIQEAQSIAISNFIQSLNAHTNLHLETFFREDPMTVEIETFKETKNNKGPSKPQINIKIDYKGMDCDVNSLSGGERDRLDLALTLALSEIFGSRILLLDECISSLDYETSAYVLEGIKENYKGKSVIVVSHQANEGDFDEVINI